MLGNSFENYNEIKIMVDISKSSNISLANAKPINLSSSCRFRVLQQDLRIKETQFVLEGLLSPISWSG